MIITSFSLYMAIIWSSLFIALIYFFRKQFFSINFISVSGILLIYLCCMARIVLPFEMPYTIIIEERGIYNWLTRLMNRMIGIGGFQCNVGFLVLGIWFIVAVTFSVCFLFDYYRYQLIIRRNYYEKITDEKLKAIIRNINTQKKHRKIEVLTGNFIKTPISAGIFKQYILLPQKEYSDDEAFYILQHEYIHLWNSDPAVKLLINILQCIFWWNPFIYLLQRDLEQILEIKCDLAVMKIIGSKKKKDYLSTMVTTIKEAHCCFKKHSTDIEERFQIVSKYEKEKGERIKKSLFYIIAIVMLGLSYSFVIQSRFDAPIEDIEPKEGYYQLNVLECYILKEGDDKYWFVLPDQEKTKIDESAAIEMEKDGFVIKQQKERFE